MVALADLPVAPDECRAVPQYDFSVLDLMCRFPEMQLFLKFGVPSAFTPDCNSGAVLFGHDSSWMGSKADGMRRMRWGSDFGAP
jgi:hypothetical protein